MTKKYLVLEKSFIGNSIREEGDIVEFDGKPGRNLQLVVGEDKPAKGKGKNADAAAGDEKDQDAS